MMFISQKQLDLMMKVAEQDVVFKIIKQSKQFDPVTVTLNINSPLSQTKSITYKLIAQEVKKPNNFHKSFESDQRARLNKTIEEK